MIPYVWVIYGIIIVTFSRIKNKTAITKPLIIKSLHIEGEKNSFFFKWKKSKIISKAVSFLNFCITNSRVQIPSSNPRGNATIVLCTKKKEPIKTTRNLMKRFYELFENEISETDKLVMQRLAGVDKFKNRFVLFFKVKSNFSFKFKIKLLINRY